MTGNVEPNPGDDLVQVKLPDKGLRIRQWNVEHLTDSKFEQVSLLLTKCTNIDILFLQETFLNSTRPDNVYNIPGYSLHRRGRRGNKSGGGLLAYIADGVKAKRNFDLDDECVESLWFNVYPHKSNRSILVGVLYHPPSTPVNIDSKIEHLIESAYLESQEVILVGDVNLDYSNQPAYSKHRLAKTLKSLNMSQHVAVVTRPKSNTCLDHIYSTHGHFISDIIVPNIGLADHLPVFVCRKYFSQNKDSGHKVINYLNFKNLNTEAFLNDLTNLPWDSAFVFDDVGDVLDALELLLNQTVKQQRVKKLKQPDWMNDRIVNAIKQHDNELKRARKSNNSDDWSKYKHTKCFVTNLIRKSKCVYFQESIENNNVIQREFGRLLNRKQSKITELTREDGSTETNTLVDCKYVQ